MFIIVIDPFCCNQALPLGPIYIYYRLVQSQQFVTKLHQDAQKRILNFKKISGLTPPDLHTLGFCSQTPGLRERRREGKGEGEGKGKGGRKGTFHLLLHQAHTAVEAISQVYAIIIVKKKLFTLKHNVRALNHTSQTTQIILVRTLDRMG